MTAGMIFATLFLTALTPFVAAALISEMAVMHRAAKCVVVMLALFTAVLIYLLNRFHTYINVPVAKVLTGALILLGAASMVQVVRRTLKTNKECRLLIWETVPSQRLFVNTCLEALHVAGWEARSNASRIGLDIYWMRNGGRSETFVFSTGRFSVEVLKKVFSEAGKRADKHVWLVTWNDALRQAHALKDQDWKYCHSSEIQSL